MVRFENCAVDDNGITGKVPLDEYISTRILDILKHRGMTQTQLGIDSGLGRDIIANIVTRRRKLSIENLGIICKCLGVDTKDILPF